MEAKTDHHRDQRNGKGGPQNPHPDWLQITGKFSLSSATDPNLEMVPQTQDSERAKDGENREW